MPSLVAVSGALNGSRFVIQEEAVIGRSPSCDVSLSDGRASRRHARLTVQAGILRISDLGSRNGTFVNGEKIDDERMLEPGDRVLVGNTAFVVDPPMAEEVSGGAASADEAYPAEDLLPYAGLEGVLLSAAGLLFSALSPGAALRRVGEELVRALSADVVGALVLREGSLIPVLVLGTGEMAVPSALVKGAMEERLVGRVGTAASAPLSVRGSEPLGLLYAQRLEEPFSKAELSLLAGVGRLTAQAIASLRQEEEALDEESILVGQSRAFRRSLEQCRKVAHSDLSVCMVGEGGTGKRLMARFSVARGPRALQPVVVVECRSPNAETQLFGSRTRPSGFARADGGTLILAGLDGLRKSAAERLLDCLQRGHAPGPDGGEIRFDVRLYSTSRSSPTRLASEGTLPFELATLCSGVEVESPPLRERPGDLPLLIAHFTKRLQDNAPHSNLLISPEAHHVLAGYPFPGNLRELRNMVERLWMLGLDEILPEHLAPETQTRFGDAAIAPLGQLLENVERQAISRAMMRADGKKVEAARMLGISRPTLDKKLSEYALESLHRRPSLPSLPKVEPPKT
jgi:DNA-binding NtrC family response regulator